MISLIREYILFLKRYLEPIKANLCSLGVILISIIAGIYINLFTGQDYIKNFFNLPLNTSGELFFLFSFGLIALMSLLRACISILVMIIFGVILGFFLFIIYKFYNWILKITKINLSLFNLTLLFVAEIIITCLFLFIPKIPTTFDLNSSVRYIIIFLILWIFGITAEKMINLIMQREKFINFKNLNFKMDEKKKFTIKIILLTLIGCLISIKLAEDFDYTTNFNNIGFIITVTIFLAGFGLIAMEKGNLKNSPFEVFLPNYKSIITWSIISMILAFCSLIYPINPWGNMFFKLATGFLFFTITLVVLLVRFNDNPYLRELELKKKKLLK